MTIKSARQRKPVPVPSSAAFITAPQLLDRYGGRSHMFLVRLLERDPKFPRPRYIGRLRFFELSAIEHYERECAANRVKETA